MITSKLTSEGRTTIPEAVRSALRLQAGDALAYEIVGQKVLLTRFQGGNLCGDCFVSFHEWQSDADAKAYAGL